MQQLQLNILSNTPLQVGIYHLRLASADLRFLDLIGHIRAGQFVNVAIRGKYLRRPISISDVDSESLSLVYKVVGEGTALLSQMSEGNKLDVLMPLGNGFTLARSGSRPVLIGGGVGVPPLLLLARQLLQQGIKADIVLGFNTRYDIILYNDFLSLGCPTLISTVDGSYGQKGMVTDVLKAQDANSVNTFFYACGPKPMLRALKEQMTIEGEISLEERMGCGFGVCMGCTCQTRQGSQRICREGPVFKASDVIF